MKLLLPLLLIGLAALTFSMRPDRLPPADTSQQVVSVHPLELNDNVAPREFEQFVTTEVVPICERIDGVDCMLAKGDRGSRIGKYAMILTFATLEDRNRIYPAGKESTEDWGEDRIWEQFAALASGLGDIAFFVDYVEVTR